MKVMTQEDLIIDVIGYILAVFVLRMVRFTITLTYVMFLDLLAEGYPKYEVPLTNFSLKLDYYVNKMRIFGVRWHFLVAFTYIVFMRIHSMYIL